MTSKLASDTFDDFQVLTEMADSHRNCPHLLGFSWLYFEDI